MDTIEKKDGDTTQGADQPGVAPTGSDQLKGLLDDLDASLEVLGKKEDQPKAPAP